MENIGLKNFHNFVVIGLGRFGKSLAINLAEAGKNVLAIDIDTKCVEEVASYVTHAVVADVSQKDVLHSLGVQDFDCAIICIGDDISSSVLATSICKELGVKYVISKAHNEQHKGLLEKIGADLVVFPEVFMSKKLSLALTDLYSNEILRLSDNHKIVEIKCPAKWHNRSIGELEIRKKFHITIIFVKRKSEIIEPTPEFVLKQGDDLIIAGTLRNIDLVENKINEMVDFKNILSDALNED